MSKIKAVAWDMDGTLANSEVLAMPAAVGAAADYVQQQQPGTVINAKERAAFVQQTMGKTITEIGEHVGHAYGVKMPEDLQARVTAQTIKILAEQCKPVDGAFEAVHGVRKQGLEQWIATSSAPERVDATLRPTGLIKEFPQQERDWFSAKATKPEPEVYDRSATTRGYKPNEIAAVEDSPTGVTAAKRHGAALIIGFTGGEHIPAADKAAHGEKLKAAGAHVIVTDLRQVPEKIAAYNEALRHGPSRPGVGLTALQSSPATT